MRPGISVVIPAYNSAAYLPDAIDSALNQTVAPLEVIVVNDGSTDETPQILERYQGRIVAITQENRGLSGARNSGIAAAGGELGRIPRRRRHLAPRETGKADRCLAEHPRAGLVHSAALVVEPRDGRAGIRFNGNLDQVAGACYQEFFAYQPRHCVHASHPPGMSGRNLGISTRRFAGRRPRIRISASASPGTMSSRTSTNHWSFTGCTSPTPASSYLPLWRMLCTCSGRPSETTLA